MDCTFKAVPPTDNFCVKRETGIDENSVFMKLIEPMAVEPGERILAIDTAGNELYFAAQGGEAVNAFGPGLVLVSFSDETLVQTLPESEADLLASFCDLFLNVEKKPKSVKKASKVTK